MYGFVNSALEKLICRRFGREKWEEIRQRANIYLGERATFLVNTVYNDDDTYVLVGATAEVLGLPPSEILEMFGEQFLVWCKESGYAKILQLLGRSLQDFLTNLDALHDHLSIIYPQMDAPSFRCTGSGSEFHLHYYSSRRGLESIVKGIVKAVAREFYDVEVRMTLISSRDDTGQDHSLFQIKEVAYHSDKPRNKSVDFQPSCVGNRQLISSESFCKCFPFHVIFDRDMNMLQVGNSLAWILPGWNQPERILNSFFALERPRMKLSFSNILAYINTIFILRLTSHSQANLSYLNTTTADPMRLRGQMLFLPESDSMLFLCSPRVSSILDLDSRGLYLSDIPMHDATRGLLMMSQSAMSEFQQVVQLEELIGKLNSAQKSLEEEKGRMRELLHQMLPISVADSLMAGQMIEAERFDSVTILFSDIVGFTSICGKCEPIQVVSMLNKLYTMFDQVVGTNRVYKVETIGDAYMVVGGLPEKNPIHAECVANQALDMMYYCKQVVRPDTEEPIMMRIGIHSGEVVAGVVGRRMPRYCLFGNTVNIASRTESNGEPGRIQVTEMTYKLLADKPNFEFTTRGPMLFKNVSEHIMCYFLDSNSEKTSYYELEVPDDVSYDFMQTSTTPPSTPFVLASSLPSYTESPSKRVAFPFISPEVNIIDSTPSHTPHGSPPINTKNVSCPFSGPSYKGGVDHAPQRKISAESMTSQHTDGSMTTPSESECSVLSNDEIIQSPPTINGSGQNYMTPPSIRIQDSATPSLLVESVIQSLAKHDTIIFPLLEDLQEDTDALSLYTDLPRVTSAPMLERQSQTLPREKKRHSVDSKSLRKVRSLSVTSDDNDSGGEESGRGSQGVETSPVRYVRPRTSSIHDRVKFFETTGKETTSTGGRGGGGRRRTGLATTSYLQSDVLENGSDNNYD